MEDYLVTFIMYVICFVFYVLIGLGVAMLFVYMDAKRHDNIDGDVAYAGIVILWPIVLLVGAFFSIIVFTKRFLKYFIRRL